MSKRFGRNQKRAMREQLQKAQQETNQVRAVLEMDRGLLRHVSEQKTYAETALRDILRNLPDGSILSEPKTIAGDLEQISRFSPIHPVHSGWGSGPHEDIQRVVHRLKSVDVRVWRDMAAHIHFRVVCPKTGQLLGYSISEDAALNLNADRFSTFVWPEIARLMEAKLCEVIDGR